MSETLAPEQALVVEETGAPVRGFAGQNIPRKEDKRLVQGDGVFVDDIKRHGMGYAHYVRSPYGHVELSHVNTTSVRSGSSG